MSTNVKLEICWILPSKQIGVRLKARVMVDKRDAFGLNWEVSTQISKWYHILLILVRRQNANIVQFTQMQQMLNDSEGLWYWLSELWHSKRVLILESKSHASLLVKMHSKRFRSRFWCKLPHFRFPQAGKNHLLKHETVKQRYGDEISINKINKQCKNDQQVSLRKRNYLKRKQNGCFTYFADFIL